MNDLKPVDVVIMLDQSGSMNGDTGGNTVWGLVTGALTTFVNSPESEGLGVGLGYFPLPAGSCSSCLSCFQPNLQLTDQSNGQCCCHSPTGQGCALPDSTPCPGGGICFDNQCYTGAFTAVCGTGNYAALEVPIDVLPNHQGTILSSIGNHSPGGFTPTGPALQGAIDAAKARAQAFPDHEVAVVLATDGVPTECSPTDVPSIAAFAAAEAPAIKTFVIGIGDTSALNQIAQAGGTDQAFLVSANGNAGDQFLAALNEIKGSLIACEFDIPEPEEGMLDYDLVNVQYSQDGNDVVIPQVSGPGDCGSEGGWYYDNPGSPDQILLCDSTCDAVAEAAGVEIVLGCGTVIK